MHHQQQYVTQRPEALNLEDPQSLRKPGRRQPGLRFPKQLNKHKLDSTYSAAPDLQKVVEKVLSRGENKH